MITRILGSLFKIRLRTVDGRFHFFSVLFWKNEKLRKNGRYAREKLLVMPSVKRELEFFTKIAKFSIAYFIPSHADLLINLQEKSWIHSNQSPDRKNIQNQKAL